jgi:hypothetical protein
MERGQRKDEIVAVEWKRGYIEVRKRRRGSVSVRHLVTRCQTIRVASAAPLLHGSAGDGGHSVGVSCGGHCPYIRPLFSCLCPSKYRVLAAAVIVIVVVVFVVYITAGDVEYVAQCHATQAIPRGGQLA